MGHNRGMDEPEKLGPLQGLIGEWEGDEGLDVSYHHAEGAPGETRYREKVTMNPFGPVDNGTQCLYGLDYRMAAWRGEEVDPLHTEIGYWLWDAGAGHVIRAFMVPRSTMVLAGADATADQSRFTMSAELGSTPWGVLETPYLATNACTVRYEVTVDVGDGEWSYESDTVLRMPQFEDLYHHTDRNTLRRVG